MGHAFENKFHNSPLGATHEVDSKDSDNNVDMKSMKSEDGGRKKHLAPNAEKLALDEKSFIVVSFANPNDMRSPPSDEKFCTLSQKNDILSPYSNVMHTYKFTLFALGHVCKKNTVPEDISDPNSGDDDSPFEVNPDDNAEMNLYESQDPFMKSLKEQDGYVSLPEKSRLVENLAKSDILSSQTYETDQIPDEFLYELQENVDRPSNQVDELKPKAP